MSEKPFEKSTCRILYFSVRSVQEKLVHIAKRSRLHFQKKEVFLIFVEDEKGEAFIDEWLWKFPAEGFLPHKIVSEPSSEPIAITRVKKNLTGAKWAFNLCSTPLLLPGFRIIYDFEDHSTQSKESLSALRFSSYQQAGYTLIHET
ncbi:MAG: DNA polymerase III subunit chi [Verrucomicrobiota bacterium]|nr:DNA polymerase III subunit chi [Verrucomicrobiota bacterium]